MALYKHKAETEMKGLMKNRVMEDYYPFMIHGIAESKYHTGSDVKNTLLKTFEKSFEDKMKPEFKKKLRNNGLNISKDDIVFFI